MAQHLFLDLDGVLAGFDEHVHALTGSLPHELGDDGLWDHVLQYPTFWLDIPLKEGADALWEASLTFRPIILTGCPRRDFDNAANLKRQWVARHFGSDVEVITCLSRDKQVHIRSGGDILVDDRHQNIKRWKKAGGLGILHKTADLSISEMRQALAS